MTDYDLAETHVSHVLFTPDYAIKFKKPVKTPFLDFSTPDRRHTACEREVLLNRRLAPDVYLDVVNLSGPRVGALDYAVVMRRLPGDRRLSSLTIANDPTTAIELGHIASILARFHESARRGSTIDAEATADSLRGKIRQNATEMRSLTNDEQLLNLVDEIEAMADRYLEGREDLFQERIGTGRIVDGHGDLLADDIFCLDDGPRLLDCLEFSAELRFGDVLADAAFLAMDLERLGRPDLAKRFLSDFAQSSADTWPSTLADFYIAYRAQIRTKVALLRGDTAEAHALAAMAVRHLRHAQVQLVLIGGAPATGKSTVTFALALRHNFIIVRSDTVRKELHGVPLGEHRHEPIDRGLYSAASTQATYREMLRRAGKHLAHGESVVLDAGWPAEAERTEARRVATSLSADIVEIHCVTDRRTAVCRAVRRAAIHADASDADANVVAAKWDARDPWPEAVVIDTTDITPQEAAELAFATMSLNPLLLSEAG